MKRHANALLGLLTSSSLLLILLFLTLLLGCGDIADKNSGGKSFSAGGDPPVGTGGKLFIANAGGASVLVYDPDARAAGLKMNGLATRTAGSSTGSVTQSGTFTGDVLTTVFQVDITDGTSAGGPSAGDPLTFTFSVSRDSGSTFISTSSPIVVTGTTTVSLQEGVSVTFTGPLATGDRFRVRPVGDQIADRRAVDLVAAHAGMALDTTNNRLFVANPANDSVIIFTSVSSPTPITNVLSGSNTGLRRPFAVAVDTVRNLLYVANTGENFGRNGIRVFAVPPGFTGGDVAPLRTFSGFDDCFEGKCLNFPRGFFVDSVNNRLYVANSSMNNVLVFQNASLQNGIVSQTDMRVICTNPDDTTPDRCVFPTIQGGPLSVYVDTTRNILYVGHGDNSIYSFNNASALGSSIPCPCPFNRRIVGLDTRLSDPVGIFVTSADQLFVASNGLNAILRFDSASTKNGNTPPNKIIAGTPTLSNSIGTRLIDPVGVQVDTAGGFLYAANGTNIIPVFSPIDPTTNCLSDPRVAPPTTSPFTPVLTCNVAPTKVLSSGQTTMASPQGIYFDKDADADAGAGTGILYVTDFNQGSILIFHNATELPLVTGTPTNRRPDRVIYGVNTRLTVNGPRGIFVDTNVASSATDNNLYVAVSGAAGANADAILVFNNAVGGICDTNPATGTLKLGELFCNNATVNVAPNRIIQGSNTQLLAPSGLFLDKTTNNLYVTNSRGSSITVFNPALTVNGNVAPTRTISGTATELNSPQGIVVDTSANNHIYVANAGNDLASTATVEEPSILIFANATTTSGSPVPLRKISGSNTTLFDPIGLQLDIVSSVVREIYVANGGRNSVVVFCLDTTQCGGTSLQNGNNNIAPRRIISGRSTTVSAPAGLFFVP